MNNEEVIKYLNEKIVKNLTEDGLIYNPEIAEDKKYRKFFATKIDNLDTITEQDITKYGEIIYKNIKSFLTEQEIKSKISFKIYRLESLHYRYDFCDLVRGIFYYKPIVTNYDRIKTMTVDEMAEWLDELLEECISYNCPAYKICENLQNCEKSIKQWLMQENKDE